MTAEVDVAQRLAEAKRLAHEKRFDESEAILRVLVGDPRRSTEAYFGLAMTSLGRSTPDGLTQAEAWLRLTLAAKPNLADAHYWLGWIAEKNGDPRAALERYRATLKVAPDHAQATTRVRALTVKIKGADQSGNETDRFAQHVEVEQDPWLPSDEVEIVRSVAASRNSHGQVSGQVESSGASRATLDNIFSPLPDGGPVRRSSSRGRLPFLLLIAAALAAAVYLNYW